MPNSSVSCFMTHTVVLSPPLPLVLLITSDRSNSVKREIADRCWHLVNHKLTIASFGCGRGLCPFLGGQGHHLTQCVISPRKCICQAICVSVERFKQGARIWQTSDLCRCTWSSGWCRFASNLEQVANVLCAQVNSTSYPQRDGKWVVAYGLRGEGLVWLIGAVVCLLAANRGASCSLTRAMDGRIVRCGIIRSWQSAAVKRFWSRTHVKSAITSIATFTFHLYLYLYLCMHACIIYSIASWLNKRRWFYAVN